MNESLTCGVAHNLRQTRKIVFIGRLFLCPVETIVKVNIDEHRLSREVQCHHQHTTTLQQSVLVLVSVRVSLREAKWMVQNAICKEEQEQWIA